MTRLSLSWLRLALPATLLVSGCSYLFSQPPPPRPLVYGDECSSSRWPVVGDVYWAINAASLAVLFFAFAGYEYQQNTQRVVPSWEPPRTLTVDRGLFIAGTASASATTLFVSSAQYGLRSARACDAAARTFVPPWAR